jgi:hypothetical protein
MLIEEITLNLTPAQIRYLMPSCGCVRSDELLGVFEQTHKAAKLGAAWIIFFDDNHFEISEQGGMGGIDDVVIHCHVNGLGELGSKLKIDVVSVTHYKKVGYFLSAMAVFLTIGISVFFPQLSTLEHLAPAAVVLPCAWLPLGINYLHAKTFVRKMVKCFRDLKVNA